MPKKYIPLSQLPKGEVGIVREIIAGRGLERRLISLGIIRGKKIKRLNDYARGPCYIGIDDMKFGLGYGITNKIIVEYNKGGG